MLGAPDRPVGPKKHTKWMSTAAVGVSERRAGFPAVLQHDGIVGPHECGSPLVDLNGRVIGLNIARAARSETYAIPTDALLPVVRAAAGAGREAGAARLKLMGSG